MLYPDPVSIQELGSLGELIAAIATVVTLIYLAGQLRQNNQATADTNRLNRANGVTQMLIEVVGNPELMEGIARSHGVEAYYRGYAETIGVSVEEAARVDWWHLYYFWLHWGQYASSTTEEDLRELANVVRAFYSAPAVDYSWRHSPFARPMLDPTFVAFVEKVLAE